MEDFEATMQDVVQWSERFAVDEVVTIANLTYRLAPWAHDLVQAVDLVGNILDDDQVTAEAARNVLEGWLYDNSLGLSSVLMMANFPLVIEQR
jgi:hypothetical protein